MKSEAAPTAPSGKPNFTTYPSPIKCALSSGVTNSYCRVLCSCLIAWLVLSTVSGFVAASTVDLMSNGGFESGSTSWHTNTLGGTLATSILAGSYPNKQVNSQSAWYAYVGDRSTAYSNSVGSLFQIFYVPPNATAGTLTFWLNLVTHEPFPYGADLMDVNFRSVSPDKLLLKIKTFYDYDPSAGSDGAYVRQTLSVDLTPYQGTEILLQFYGVTDGLDATIFRIDDVSLVVTLANVPTVDTLDATSVTVSSAQMNGDVNPNGSDTAIWFEYGPTTDYGYSTGRGDAGSGTALISFASTFTGLPSNATYHYRAWASNAGGTVHGTDKQFATGATPAPPSNLTASSGLTGINLGWTDNSADETGFTIQRRQVSNGVLTSFGVAANQTSYIDSSAAQGVPYCYTVRATNGAGDSAQTTEACATFSPCPAPVALISGDAVTSPGKLNTYRNVGTTGACYTYAWTTDDHQSLSTQDATLAFSSTGTHWVQLIVTNSQAQQGSITSIQVSVQSQVVGSGGGGSSGNSRQTLAADPVNLASGNYIYQHTYLHLPGIGMPLEPQGFYNSRSADQGRFPLGFGWTFGPSLSVVQFGTNAVVTYADGHNESQFLQDDGTWKGDHGVFDQLSKSPDGAWQLITKSQTTYLLDLTGRLSSITDRNNNTIYLAYDDTTGRLTTLSNSVGRVLTVGPSWRDPALIGSIRDPIGRQILFGYDDQTNLVAVTNALGTVTRFAYDDQHRMTDLTNNNGNLVVHNDYDSTLNVVTNQVDAYSNQTSFTFDFTKHETVQINALGKPSTNRFDDNLLLTNVIDEAGNQQFFRYDADHNRILIQDKNGHATQYTFDERGNVTNKLDSLNHSTSIEYDERNNPTRRVDALTNETTFGYNLHGNLTSTTNALRLVTSAQYDAVGEPHVLTDANEHSKTNIFDLQGNLSATVDTLGFTNLFFYDEVGRKVMQIDSNGHTNHFGYDNDDNVVFSVDGLGNTNQFFYDANDNRHATVDARTPPATNTVFFDLKDRVSGTQDALGAHTTNYFDALDRKVASLDARSNLTQYGYDDVGNLVAVTNALNQVSRFGYDHAGNQTTVTNAAGHVTTRQFDELNRVIYLIDALNHTNATGFDALGRINATRDANGQLTAFFFDSVGRLTNVIDEAAGSVIFDYDRAGNRVHTTGPNGNVSTNMFNEVNRVVERWDPIGHVTTFAYDGVGNVTTKTTPNGVVINYSFDAKSRLTNIVFPNGPPTSFSYDSVGNRTRMVDGLGTTTWQFDLLNRLTSVTDPYNNSVRNDFDENGNRIALTYPDGNAVHYSFDALNRMSSLTNWFGGVLSYGYDVVGNLVGATNANNTTAAYAYDDANRLVALTNTLPDGSVISQYALTLDGVGNPRQIAQEEPLTPIILNQTNTYAYDAANRLMSVGGQSVAHDADGNLTVWGTNTFGFDYLDRLTNTVSGGMTGTSAYDGLGNRLNYATGGTERHFVLDRFSSLAQVLAETDTNGNVLSDYVYGLGLVERISAAGSVHEYHFDPRGNAIALSDAPGSLTDSYAYRVFGELANSQGATINSFHGLGRHGIIDDGNGLLHVRARDYSPDLGRFITMDTVGGKDGDGQSLNLYIYALNNPMRLLDVTGFSATEGNLLQFPDFAQRSTILPEQVEVLAPVTANSTPALGQGAWSTPDFVYHYFYGHGAPIDLADVGLLSRFQSSPSVKKAVQAFEDKLRQHFGNGPYEGHFPGKTSTDVTSDPRLFSVGGSTFFENAVCTQNGGSPVCSLTFSIRDSFTDPLRFQDRIWSHLPNSDTFIQLLWASSPLVFTGFPTPYPINAQWNQQFNP